MEFTLTYRGQLVGNGDAKEKQEIREYLHPQLKELWERPPLKGKQRLWTTTPLKENDNMALVESLGGFSFIPLVSDNFHLAAELRISFLRNGPPGSLIKQGGDLDNRLKTLFDALTIPDSNQITKAPPSVVPPGHFFCLLKNDILIHSFSVDADWLLDGTRTHALQPRVSPGHPELEVLLLIRVITRTTQLMIFNLDV